MTDWETRFAAKLAREVGRLDFLNVYEEHTPYEWQVQQLLYQIEPFGEDRADLRSAVSTARMVATQAAEPLSDQQWEAEINNCRFYLEVNRPPEVVLTPAQAAAMHG